ncbi:hypothetical protein VNO78_15655 [Psophocarpus tetragonolobus]|uniref:Uncharacterized protein n=1 Tax=Psophocarpus tetragonolobus TaxID=3891 RepID=A0AAN9XK39_PSOTE
MYEQGLYFFCIVIHVFVLHSCINRFINVGSFVDYVVSFVFSGTTESHLREYVQTLMRSKYPIRPFPSVFTINADNRNAPSPKSETLATQFSFTLQCFASSSSE